MQSDYEAIAEENRRRYGTDIGRIGPMLLADRYDDRAHFIFELLQNAEDALGRRDDRHGPRSVAFELTSTSLTVSHFGKPFDEADVRGVCGIAESTKDKLSIGRFGIGFKSVYTFTNRPEIHSGEEDFAIENYVQPRRAERTPRARAETQIVLPLKPDDSKAPQEITTGLRHLGADALLFLHEIEEITWTVSDGGPSGSYLRGAPESLGPNVQRITVIGQESGKPDVDQSWLAFHREMHSEAGERVGRVEVAFSLTSKAGDSGQLSVQPIANSPLVVFFPTVVSTHLGFLVQGPYRTTPSRDNIPRNDPWNQFLVNETASLLVDAIRWMRDRAILDTSTLRCLPLDHEKFRDGAMFAPIFETVRQALRDEPLLPSFGGGYVAAGKAKLARTRELRELFSPQQMSTLLGSDVSAWVTDEITADKEAELRQYLLAELGIAEVVPRTLIPQLTREFLEAQSDEWVLQLYEFLGGQEAALRRHLDSVPLVRLEDGTHVIARENGKSNAFLPSGITTDFPTVRRAVCGTPEVRSFLYSLGITEPDPVDDVIWNVLPRYEPDEIDDDAETYAADITRITSAFGTDSAAQREKLVSALRETSFVRVVDTGDGQTYFATPGESYIATDRLKQLFEEVSGVLVIDDTYTCLRGEDVRDVLVACDASRYLAPVEVPSMLTLAERAHIRREAGLERASWEHLPEDFTLRGVDEVLELLPNLDAEEAKSRAKLLWDSLADLEARGTGAFFGSYRWGYSHEAKTARFDAAFVRQLNEAAWIPDGNGKLAQPRAVLFQTLGWKPNPFLLSKIIFRPPVIEQLAKEVGIEPEALDLLRKLGISSVAELTSRLGLPEQNSVGEDASDSEPEEDPTFDDVYGNARDLYGSDMPVIPPGAPDPEGGEGVGGTWVPPGSKGHSRSGLGESINSGKRKPGSGGARKFISYIGAHLDDQESDPDGLDQAARMRLEADAISLIIEREPTLQRTSAGNPGFDLCESDGKGRPIRWVEVKSMTGSLDDRPVGLSHTQFEYARQKGDAYWLYVVENASDRASARVVRIQNPFAHARTFTFDSGWRSIAQAMEPT